MAATMENNTCLPKVKDLQAFRNILNSCLGILNSNWLELFKHVTLGYFRPQNCKQSCENYKDKIWYKGRNIFFNVNAKNSYTFLTDLYNLPERRFHCDFDFDSQ